MVLAYELAFCEQYFSEIEIIRMDKRTKFYPATTAEISKMEEVLEWLLLLDGVDDKKLVWMRAENTPWEEIAKTFGVSRVTASKKYKNAINFIAHNCP